MTRYAHIHIKIDPLLKAKLINLYPAWGTITMLVQRALEIAVKEKEEANEQSRTLSNAATFTFKPATVPDPDSFTGYESATNPAGQVAEEPRVVQRPGAGGANQAKPNRGKSKGSGVRKKEVQQRRSKEGKV